MSGESEVQFSLTLVLNKEKTKVLFAYVDNTFADVLLSFLALPLGRILKLLQDHYGDQAPSIGSLNTLYTGLQNLDDVYFGTKASKLMLLDPKSSLDYEECLKLKLDVCSAQPTKYFTCDKCSKTTLMATLYHEGSICQCGKSMDNQINLENLSSRAPDGDSQVFTKQSVSFFISDDLQMVPNVSGSCLQNLRSLGITDIHGAHLNTVTIGFNEIMDLLKGLLVSRTPLTDLFLHSGQEILHHSATTNSEQLPPHLRAEENCSSSKRIKVKAMIQKSRNKFLFAEAEEDFVEFLFSMLTIPLGQVGRLSNANSGLRSIDNLYRSVVSFNEDECLVAKHDTKDVLLNPKLPCKYLSNNNVCSLAEKENPKLYLHKGADFYVTDYWSLSSSANNSNYKTYLLSFVDPKGQLGSYIEKAGKFMVTDDLIVTPVFNLSIVSALMGMDISLTDIEELEINIGLEEACNIVKASLTSNCAMTNGLKLNTSAPRN